MPKNQSIANPFSQSMTWLYQAGFVLDANQRKRLGIAPPPTYKHLRGESASFVLEPSDDLDEFRRFDEFICAYDLRFVRLEEIKPGVRDVVLLHHLDYECIYPSEHYRRLIDGFKSIGAPVEKIREFVCILNFESGLGLVSFKVGRRRFVLNTTVLRDWADALTQFRMLYALPAEDRKLASFDGEYWFYLNQWEFDCVSKVYPDLSWLKGEKEAKYQFTGIAKRKEARADQSADDVERLYRVVRCKDRKQKGSGAIEPRFLELSEAHRLKYDLQVKPANRRVKAWRDAIWCDDERIEEQLISDLRGNRGLDVLHGGCEIADGALRSRRNLAGLIVEGFRDELRNLFQLVRSSKAEKLSKGNIEWRSVAWRPSLQCWEASRWFGVAVRRTMIKNMQLDGLDLAKLNDFNDDPSLGRPIKEWLEDH